ncbi:MAG: iron-containing alcohol dehydrogenase [Chloroflexi bacterium]|nr:iron-containing alcohol dehydrogenase [Chloroflexota bacterium]
MTSAKPLDYQVNTVDRNIICAPDAISGMADSLEKLGASRALVVCGPTILEHADVVQRVQQALGDRCIGLYSGVAPHAPVEMLEEAVATARELQPDALVAVGGGSTSDTCKGIAVLLAEGGDILDYVIRFEPPDRVFVPDTPHQKIPIIAVATTFGGAEIGSGGGGFTSKSLGRKLSLAGEGTTPKVVIIDGAALATTPMDILLSTGIGQFRIAVESIYSKDHHPIGDALALHTIKMLVEYLPRCSKREIDCLLQAKSAACMVMLARPGLGLNTAIAHHVGGLYDVPHGEANAILLPHTMRFNLDASADRQVLIAQAMGIDISGMTDQQAGMAAADGVDRICRTLEIPERLRDVGVPEDGLELIAAATLHDRSLATNPKPVDNAGPIMSVLRDAW